MKHEVWYAVFATAIWTALLFTCLAVYYFASSLGSLPPSRGRLRRSAAGCAGVAGILAMASGALPSGFNILALPVIWPILPFSAWAAIACLGGFISACLSALLRGAASRLWSSVAYAIGGLAFLAIFRHSGDKAAIAEGAVQLSPIAVVGLTLLAVVCLVAMAGSAKAIRARGYAKVFATHLALLAGSLIFGLPFFWLLVTSFKEDRDMAAPTGIVWVPRVQETVSTYDSIPPLFETTDEGRSVQVNVLSENTDGTRRVEIIRPAGMQGRSLDVDPGKLKRVPSDAPVVKGPYEGQTVEGYVIQNYDDGRQKVKIMQPAKQAGQIFVGLPRDLVPVRHVGLRLKNYSDALEYLPPEADNGLVYFSNTALVAILSVLGTVLSSSVVAYGFSRIRFPGRDLLFGLMLSTMMLPAAVTLLPRFIIFRDLGWIDTLYPLWAPAFFASAFNVFLLRQFFKNIPGELEDAAKIDGCSYLRSYWSVMMPQIKPALAVIGIWTFMGAWNDFMGPLIYITSPEKMTISYAVQMFATDRTTQPGLMMAFATMSIIPVVLLFFFAQRYFIEGVTLSGFGGK